jgi:hypothetical protein
MAALVACTGCAQLFGLDNTTGGDAAVDVTTLQVERVSIGASVIKAPQDLSAQTAQFLTDDGTKVDGTLVGTDTFSAPLLGTPAVMYTVPDTVVPRRLLALPSRAQKSIFAVYEHPGTMPPLPSSQIALSVTLPSAFVTGETFLVQSIGAWMQSAVAVAAPDTGVTTVSQTLDYATFTSMTGGAKARITSSDVTLLLRYVGTTLSGVLQAQFDQTDGADGMSGTMTAVAADKTATATLDSTGYATRFSAVRPAVATYASSWRVNAAPGWSVNSDVGVRLASGANGPAATMFTATYGNPFESLDWKAIVAVGAQQSRVYAYTENAMTANITLLASLAQYGEPSQLTSITMPAGLATTIRADQNLLTTDGASVKLDLTKPVEVDAIVDMPSNTLYEMTLTELGLDITGSTPVVTRKIVLDAITTSTEMPVFKVPPDLFTVGNSYFITVRIYQGGFTDPQSGDLTLVELPYGSSAVDSAVFKVEMP